MTWSTLSWNWHQTVKFLTSKVLASDPLDMSPCPKWELNPSKISQQKRSWSCKTSFLNMISAKFSTKGIWGVRVNPNPPICRAGLGFELTTVAIHWLVDLAAWSPGRPICSHCFSTQCIVSWTSLIRGTTPVTLHGNVTIKVNFSFTFIYSQH